MRHHTLGPPKSEVAPTCLNRIQIILKYEVVFLLGMDLNGSVVVPWTADVDYGPALHRPKRAKPHPAGLRVPFQVKCAYRP